MGLGFRVLGFRGRPPAAQMHAPHAPDPHAFIKFSSLPEPEP